ncbi:MAG: pantoate--beta-alanine ligase, partial [Acidobacteria bacterium]
SREARSRGARIGLVPTMGALHQGHLSLVGRARTECTAVVVSIYVNPLQFGPREDFKAYPRDLERDKDHLRASGCDVLFVPQDGEIHVPGHRTTVEVQGMQDLLCGRSRPGHFRGVTTVVAKLLAIVQPDAAYFGEKDAQQVRIIRRMALDLHEETRIISCPIVREADGLAMSSRNIYLSAEEKRAAPVLYRALRAAAERARSGETDAARLASLVRETIAREPLARIDYVEVVDGETLEPVTTTRPGLLLAVAVWFGGARLIDNIAL